MDISKVGYICVPAKSITLSLYLYRSYMYTYIEKCVYI